MSRNRLVFGSEEANRIARGEKPYQHPPADDASKERTPMTDRERYAARCLARCTFRIASYNKRFARAMGAIANEDDGALTQNQRNNLWRLVYRYRRQIPDDELIAEALQKIKEMDYRDV